MTGTGAPEPRAAADASLAGRADDGAAADADAADRDLLEACELRYAFGPVFFLTHLRAFVRDHCPDPAEGLPAVELALADGGRLRLCHVIGVAPAWVALAVVDEDSAGERTMRTEFVPYASISRVGVRPTSSDDPGIGFSQSGTPVLLGERARAGTTAEDVVRAAAGAPGLGGEPSRAQPCHQAPPHRSGTPRG